MEEVKLSLNTEEVKNAIIDYYSSILDCMVSCYEELSIKNKEANISFFLVEYFDEKNIKSKRLLSLKDLNNVFSYYANNKGYELLDFKYIGGIHNMYIFGDDVPYFEGIQLKLKEKGISKSLRK